MHALTTQLFDRAEKVSMRLCVGLLKKFARFVLPVNMSSRRPTFCKVKVYPRGRATAVVRDLLYTSLTAAGHAAPRVYPLVSCCSFPIFRTRVRTELQDFRGGPHRRARSTTEESRARRVLPVVQLSSYSIARTREGKGERTGASQRCRSRRPVVP